MYNFIERIRTHICISVHVKLDCNIKVLRKGSYAYSYNKEKGEVTG